MEWFYTKDCYYDDYIDSGLPQEERNRIDEESQKEDAKLKSWDEVDS